MVSLVSNHYRINIDFLYLRRGSCAHRETPHSKQILLLRQLVVVWLVPVVTLRAR